MSFMPRSSENCEITTHLNNNTQGILYNTVRYCTVQSKIVEKLVEKFRQIKRIYCWRKVNSLVKINISMNDMLHFNEYKTECKLVYESCIRECFRLFCICKQQGATYSIFQQNKLVYDVVEPLRHDGVFHKANICFHELGHGYVQRSVDAKMH